MRNLWTDRRCLAINASLLLLAFQPAFAQRGGGGAGGIGGSTSGSTTSGSRGNFPSTSTTGIGNTPNSTSPTLTRPIFLSGKVMFDDGTPPNADIRIERVCGGSPHLEAHTDSKGRFSFQVGQDPVALSDASESPSGTYGNPNSQLGTYGIGMGSGSSPIRQAEPLWNCELRATYPGFRSDVVELSTRRSLDDPDVGTIILHRLVNVKGSTISVTSELAPKRAQKDYQKGLQCAEKGKLDEAEKDFTQATTIYT